MLKLKLSSCSFTRSEIQGAAIFENNEIDKKKSQRNAPLHGLFRDEIFLEMISSHWTQEHALDFAIPQQKKKTK